MKTYTIRKFDPALGWDGIPVLSIDELLWTESCEVSARGQLAYSSEAILVRLCAREAFIRAEGTGLLDAPCEDSCLEFFFRPMAEDRRYFNVEFNPNACVFLGMGSGTHDLVRLLPVPPVKELFHPQVSRTGDGWELVYEIPFSFIRRFFPDFAVFSGKLIRANCYKCGDLTVAPHYLAWNPIENETPAFHMPDQFGTMIFA